MVRKFTLSFMGLFLVLFIATILFLNINKPRILVLHSYSEDYVWTREINVGLQRALDNENWLDVHYHEMKTKRHSDQDYLRRSAVAAHKAIETLQPDVLIAIDDYAQKLVAMDLVNSAGMDIVFAGVNGSVKPYGYDTANNVTGVLERKPARALKEVITFLSSSGGAKTDGNPRALFLADSSHSTERDADYLKTFDWSPVQYLGVKSVASFPEWQDAVKALSEKTDFLLVGGYRKLHATSDPDSPFVKARKVMSWTEENSPVPVIGMNIFNTAEGAMLSVGISPYEQGEVAATMALDIIRNKKTATAIPIHTPRQYVISIRQSALDRRKIVVPDIFETFARATNNYFE